VVELSHNVLVLIADHLVSHRANGLNPARHALDVRTRDRVRQAIFEDGPLTATLLATRLGLTPAAVRRHLDPLVEKGAIEEQEPATAVRRGRGRPARAYVLSAAGHAHMDSDYDDAATAALRCLAEHAGEEAVGEFARKRIAEVAQRYAAELAAAGEDVTARAEAPARLWHGRRAQRRRPRRGPIGSRRQRRRRRACLGPTLGPGPDVGCRPAPARNVLIEPGRARQNNRRPRPNLTSEQSVMR
jgi:predicted ArsR family transcriptional regulator